MSVPSDSVLRNDRALIMARGRSHRMGSPKGLLRFSGDGSSFLRMITGLYLDEGYPVDVVCTVETAAAYREELPPHRDVRVLEAGPGGDTARTVMTAWQSLVEATIPCSHIWAHPVDLPLVKAATIHRLRQASEDDPSRIIRPGYRDTPGHPVIIPASSFAALGNWLPRHDGPLRDFLTAGVSGGWLPAVVTVEVDDEGTIKDFDRPEDFGSDQLPTDNRGTP